MATAGQDTTVMVDGNTYTFSGSPSGVTTVPAPTTQYPTLPAGSTTLSYSVAAGQTLRITYTTN